MNVQAIGTSSVLNNIETKKTAIDPENGNNFSKMINDAIGKVNDSQINADNKIESFVKGEDVNMHEVMLSMQEAQISMQLLIEVRNKVVEAYQEVNKIQL